MQDAIPKKALGQHWLHDTHTLQTIVRSADIHPNDVVVEVGPGLGTLTTYLAQSGAKVIAVEYDADLSHALEVKSPQLFGDNHQNITIVNEDILTFRFDQIPQDYKVVANIPYYLTSNLIRVLSESSNPPETVVLLVQKEVTERVCSKPGDMSLLSVWAQMYFECSLGLVVPAALFTPPPKVDSQVVIMNRRPQPLFGETDLQSLRRIVKAGFSNKRKTLHNSLASGLHLGKDEVANWLNANNITLNARPQELSLNQWIDLADTHKTKDSKQQESN